MGRRVAHGHAERAHGVRVVARAADGADQGGGGLAVGSSAESGHSDFIIVAVMTLAVIAFCTKAKYPKMKVPKIGLKKFQSNPTESQEYDV